VPAKSVAAPHTILGPRTRQRRRHVDRSCSSGWPVWLRPGEFLTGPAAMQVAAPKPKTHELVAVEANSHALYRPAVRKVGCSRKTKEIAESADSSQLARRAPAVASFAYAATGQANEVQEQECVRFISLPSRGLLGCRRRHSATPATATTTTSRVSSGKQRGKITQILRQSVVTTAWSSIPTTNGLQPDGP